MNLYTIIWATWFLSEILISVILRSGKKDLKGRDKGSILIIWITIILANFSGVIFSIRYNFEISGIPLISYIGLGIIIFGIAFRVLAILSLGRLFTVHVTIRDEHKIKKDGIYKLIRHPSYTGSLLSFLGFGISLNNWGSVLIIFIPVTLAMLYRIGIEEKVLIEQFASEYLDYKKETYRLIPYIY